MIDKGFDNYIQTSNDLNVIIGTIFPDYNIDFFTDLC